MLSPTYTPKKSASNTTLIVIKQSVLGLSDSLPAKSSRYKSIDLETTISDTSTDLNLITGNEGIVANLESYTTNANTIPDPRYR